MTQPPKQRFVPTLQRHFWDNLDLNVRERIVEDVCSIDSQIMPVMRASEHSYEFISARRASDIEKKLDNGGVFIFSLRNSSILGYCEVMEQSAMVVQILALMIQAPHRRGRVFFHLLTSLLSHLDELAPSEIVAQSHVSNLTSISLMKHFGFKPAAKTTKDNFLDFAISFDNFREVIAKLRTPSDWGKRGNEVSSILIMKE